MTPDQLQAMRSMCVRLAAVRNELGELAKQAFDAHLASVSEVDVWRLRTAADLLDDFLDQGRRAIRIDRAMAHVAEHCERPGFDAQADPVAQFAFLYDELRGVLGFAPIAFRDRLSAYQAKDLIARSQADPMPLSPAAAAAVELAGQA